MKNYQAARTYKPEKKTCWYVVANRAGAVIYKDNDQHQFDYVYRFTNSKARKKESELDSDRPGKGASSASKNVRHSLDKHNNKHEVVAVKFSKKIAEALSKGAQEKRFDELVLVAEPHFLGLLRDQVPLRLRPLIKYEVHHEYLQGSQKKLRERILKAIESEEQ